MTTAEVLQASVRPSTTRTGSHPHNSTTSHKNTNTKSTKVDTSTTMVAPDIFSTTGTPPESPHRSRIHSMTMTSQFMVHPSPSKSNSKSNSKSPTHNRRASFQADSPTRLMAEQHSNNNSPIPLGSRIQPATATAPVVGRHHKKSNSLIGFDPLLSGSSVIATPPRLSHTTTTSGTSKKEEPLPPPVTPTTSKDVAVPPSLSNLSLSPPQSPNEATKSGEMSKELRQLAKDLSASSPKRNSNSNGKSPGSSKSSKPKFGSLTPKFNLTPPFRSSTASNNPATNSNNTKEPLSAPHRKLPWQRHRRSQSLETPNHVIDHIPTRVDSFENDSRKANHNNNTTTGLTPPSPITPMMQDLYDVVKAQQSSTTTATLSLALPNLYKPAPTSFLTGSEIVRSSEQDPSPFQIEIPSLEQTLVTARAVQFVDVYRKEDMNLDLQSLVALPRMAMRSFVETSDSPPPNKYLTQAHRPVLESLLEVADDVTVAGFFATENAGSADVRREVVLLERQMQFVVVFRGTTAEQSGKAALFSKKKTHPDVLEALSSSTNTGTGTGTSSSTDEVKVYASVKQAYMELEQHVFDCLDRFLDENPFCDVVFTGSSFGGAMATLAAYRYATNRPVVRVACQTFGAPKAGNVGFRQQANSLPNLKVMRVEYGNDFKCFAPHDSHGAHVGHSILLTKNNNSDKTLSAVACKFDNHEARKQHASKSAATLLATFKKERDITSYVSHLEQLNQSKKAAWVKDFAGEDGTGVRGKDDEQRLVV